MIVVRTRAALTEELERLRPLGETLALVPTMGFLHEGHLSLVDLAGEMGGRVAVSIFVNPLQFGPAEDLSSYPRDEERDLGLLEARGAELVFAPSTEEMYPDGEPRITVSPGALGNRLCGAFRPGHFRGVLTVVARLFGLFRPEVAVFGRKDFQQAVLIRRMVRDLELRVRVETGPIVRERDGLAMSSRNTYLNDDERRDARGLHGALYAARRLYDGGERRADVLLQEVFKVVAEHRQLELQYAELVAPDTLAPLESAQDGSVLALAAFCGTTRLIDNMEL